MRIFILALAGGAFVATSSLAADKTKKAAPVTLETIAGVDPTGVIKPLSKVRLGLGKAGHKCVTPFQNVEYVVGAVWSAYQIACKAGLKEALAAASTTSPVMAVLATTCTSPDLYTTLAKLISKATGPRTFDIGDGKGAAGATRWFTDKGWFSNNVVTDSELYVTVTREKNPSGKPGTAKVYVCGVGMAASKPKENGDWDVKASTCGCEKFDFTSTTADQVIVPMKDVKGKLLHVFVNGLKGTFRYTVAVSKTPAESPAFVTAAPAQ
jgi:hypothetical protein